MNTISWYFLGVVIALVMTGLMTVVDIKLHDIRPPYFKVKVIMLAARWAFWCSIAMYAFLIDSRRVPYEEPGIWLFLGAGIGLAVFLTWVRKFDRT